MNKSKRSRRRLIIAGVLCGLVITSTAVLVIVRAQVTEQVQTEVRATGMEAYQSGDYAEAMHHLSYYLSNQSDDVEALLAFADSRSKVVTDDHRHIIEPISLYNAVLAQDSDNRVALDGLLHLYQRTGRRLEWMETAERLLSLEPNHVEALRLRATGHAFESEFFEAETYIERLIEIEPDNIEWRRFYLSIGHSRGASLEELLDRCHLWISTYEGDGRFYMVKANVLATAGLHDRARDSAREAARHGATKRDVLQQIISMLDILQLFDEADSLIKTTIELYPDEFWPYEAMVRRQWQQGRLPEALTTVDIVEAERGELSIELLQWKSLLHVLRRDVDDAEQELTLLADRAEESEASRDSIRAWIQAARARNRIHVDDWVDTLNAYRSAVSLDPQNPTLYYLMGEAYSHVGEFELAAQALEQAVRSDPNWMVAQIMYIEALLRTGRYQQAGETASSLLQRSERPTMRLHLQFARAVLGTRLAVEQHGFAQRVAGRRIDMVAFMEAILKQFPHDAEVNELLIRVYLRDERREDAIRYIRRVLDTDEITIETMVSLARQSKRFNLGYEQELVDRAREMGGLELEIAALQARLLHRDGRTEEGLDLLREARSIALQESGDDQQESVRNQADVAIIRYLTWSGHAEAAGAMDRYLRQERSAERASLVLGQEVTWHDEKLADEAISILEENLGQTSPLAVMARVRHTIQYRASDDAALAGAMKNLNSILQQTPESVEAHTLMAGLYLTSDSPNKSAAIRHLRRAITAQPDRVELYPQLISLLQSQGDFATAERYLTVMGRLAGDDDVLLRALVHQYESQGDYEAIVARLSSHTGTLKAESDRLFLFKALNRTGRTEEAEMVLQQLLDRPQPGNDVYFAAAEFFSKTNRPQEGLQLIKDRLLNEQPGLGKLLIGRIHDEHGFAEDAEMWLQAAVEHMPENSMAWNQLATHYLARGMFAEAKGALERGLSYIGEDAVLRTTLAVVSLNLDGAARRQALSMLDEFDDGQEAVVRLIRLSSRLSDRSDGSPPGRQILSELRELVRDEPSFRHGWRLAISSHAEAGEFDVASQLARQAVGRFPNDPGITELATHVLLGMGDLAGAQEMASIWRRRSLDRPFEADRMLARIALRQEQPRVAADRLERYIEYIIDQRDRSPEDLTILLTTLLQSGQDARAADLVAPLLQESGRWVEPWIDAAQTLSATRTENALAKLEGVIPDSPTQQVQLAQAWGRLGAQTRQPLHYERGLALAEAVLPVGGESELAARMVIAGIAQLREDYQTAEKHYRAVLEVEPDHWRALSFLSKSLLVAGASKSEAYELARQARAIEPNHTVVLESYVNALLAHGRADEAVALLEPQADAHFEVRHDQPGGIMLWIRALVLSNEEDRAKEVMHRILSDDAHWAERILTLSRQLPSPQASVPLETAAAQLQQTPRGRLAIGAEWAVLGERIENEDYLSKALAYATEVYENYPEMRPQALMLRATVKERMLDDHAAEQAYRRVLEHHPGNWIAMNNLAALLLRTNGSPQEVLDLTERAIGAGPELPELLDTRARALLAANRPEEAMEAVRQALRVYPTRSAFLLTMTEIALAIDQPDKARESFAAAERRWKSEDRPDRLLAQQMTRVRNKVNGIQ